MRFNFKKAKDGQPKVAKKTSATSYRLSSSVGNELRVLISEILGMDAMLLKACKDPSSKELANNIMNTGRNLLSLVNDVVDFSRIESGDMEIQPVTYSLFTLLSDSFGLYEARARDKGLNFSFAVDPNLPESLYGDEFRIRQIVNNLLFYSIRYTVKGEVVLDVGFDRSSTQSGGRENSIDLKICVRDTGDGIPKEAMEHLFQISQRIEEQRNVAGVDLGLNLTKRIVDLLGGDLLVESDYGQGTSFRISIPQEVKKETVIGNFAERRSEYLAASEMALGNFYAPNVKILVADDVPMNIRVIRGFLKESAIEIEAVNNGMEALEKIKRNRYDLIFLDYEMPVMNGLETLEILRTLSGNQNVDSPVIVLLTDDSLNLRENYLRAGFADCLVKPVREDALFLILSKHLPKESWSETMPAESAVEEERQERSVEKNVVMSPQRERIHLPELGVSSSLLQLAATGFVDVHMGLDYFQNDENFYKESLCAFAETRRESILDQSIESGDYEMYRLEARSLKCSALAIGAIDMASRAKAMEVACLEARYDFVQMNHENFIREYKNLVNVLKEMA